VFTQLPLAYSPQFNRYKFEDAVTAFESTRAGKSQDGTGVIKAIISGPGVSPEEK
jgi:D-xylulose reductase